MGIWSSSENPRRKCVKMNFDVIVKYETQLTSGIYLTKERIFSVMVVPEYFMKFEFDDKYSNTKDAEIVSIYSNTVKRSTGFGDFTIFYWLINRDNCSVIVFVKSENKSVNEYLYGIGLLKVEMRKDCEQKRE